MIEFNIILIIIFLSNVFDVEKDMVVIPERKIISPKTSSGFEFLTVCATKFG